MPKHNPYKQYINRGFRYDLSKSKMKSTATKAAIAYKEVKKLEKAQEWKYHDLPVTSATAANDLGDIKALNHVDQATTVQNSITRDGDRFTMKSLEATYTFNLGSAVDALVRVIIFLDTKPDGSTPALTGTPGLLANATIPVPSPRDLAYRNRYKILVDKVFQLSDVGVRKHIIKIYKKLNYHVVFNGANASYTTIRKNGLYSFVLSDYANAGANDPTYKLFSRIRFTDD